MTAALGLYLVVLAAVVLFFVGALAYYQAAAAPGQALRKRGLTPRWVAAAFVASFGVVVGFGSLGDVNVFALGGDIRGFGFVVTLFGVPLLLGLLGLGAGYGQGRRWRRFHPTNDAPTGAVTSGTVACTGPVTDTETATAPVTGREGCCWSWSVEVLDPHGASAAGQRERWATVAGGVGGVPFEIDDGSGPLAVDPTGATVDLAAERTLRFAADERPPDSFGTPDPDVERMHGDKQRRYTETLLAPGDHAAVTGTATRSEEALVVAGDHTHVAVGSLATAATRYRNRALLYACGGLVGVAVGLWGLTGLFGVGP
ncbi:GIDE domain-containing protein [Haloarcula salina]|uniref:GIDE domain-containing protein n=1 Tax=Haloarcula salina TaxID=1429914 RepID=UPI003C6EDE74